MERGMDMGWILILFIWLVAPFAQLGIIIYLLVLTDKYKKQIRELERGALRARAFVPLADAPGTGEKDRPVLKGDFSLQPDPPWQIAEKRAETWSPKETVLGEKPEFERGPAFQSVSVFVRPGVAPSSGLCLGLWPWYLAWFLSSLQGLSLPPPHGPSLQTPARPTWFSPVR